MLLTKEFTFDAAHNLVAYHGKCERLHGHTYRMAVTVSGNPDEEGMIVDFIELKAIVKQEVLDKFDHAYLNDIIPQPTAEYIARYVFERLDPRVRAENRALHSVQIWETATSSATFFRDDLDFPATGSGAASC